MSNSVDLIGPARNGHPSGGTLDTAPEFDGPGVPAPSQARPNAPRAAHMSKAAQLVGSSEASPRTIQTDTHPARALASVPTPPAKPAEQVATTPLREAFEQLDVGPAQATLLTNGFHAWVERWNKLGNAKSSIKSYYFSVERDVFGYAFLGMLLKKQREGVPVQLGVDHIASVGGNGFKKGDLDYLDELTNSGAVVKRYHTVTKRFNPIEWLSTEVLASNHDKILVIDGEHSFTGGRNIAKEYYISREDDPNAWSDVDVYLKGPHAAAQLTRAWAVEFENDRVNTTVWGDVVYNWTKRDIVLLGAASMMDAWMQAPVLDAAAMAALDDATAREAAIDTLVDAALANVRDKEGVKRTPEEWEITKLRELAAELVDNPRLRGAQHKVAAMDATSHQVETAILDRTSSAGTRIPDTLATGLSSLLEGASDHVYNGNPYVVPTEEYVKALTPVGRGRIDEDGKLRDPVELTIGTNSPLSTDSDVTQAFFLEYWPDLLARIPNLRIFVATGTTKFHLKASTADEQASLISTYNHDFLSMEVNGEVGAVIWSKEFTAELNAYFFKELNDSSNGALEYTIERDKDGKPIFVDGKPVVKFGPEDHLSQEMLDEYADKRADWRRRAKLLPWLRDLRHPPTEATYLTEQAQWEMELQRRAR